MNITLRNNTDSDIEIEDLSSFLITASGTEVVTDYFSDGEITNSNDLIQYVGVSDIAVDSGSGYLEPAAAIKKLMGMLEEVKLHDEYRDRSGKLRFHQTSRKLGTRIMWTGIGDDPSDVTKVGGGETLTFNHQIGDQITKVKYIDFNIAENETWLHEGYITWSNAKLDTLSLQMVPRTVTVSGVTGGDKTVYGGYLVVPTPPGHGNYEVVNDLSEPNGGLVYMPNNDLDEEPTAYWDADYNETTHKYENIVPNYTATGRYNIFSLEIVFAEFMRNIPFLGSGFIALNSSDTDQVGHGMRLKMLAGNNEDVPDHDWSLACIMCLHRNSSV